MRQPSSRAPQPSTTDGGTLRRLDFAPVRAVTIQDGELVVEERPDPEPAPRRGAGAGAGRRAERRRHAPGARRATPPRPGRRPTSRGSSWPARWRPLGPGRRALRGGRPGDGGGRRRRPGRAGRRARARRDAGPGRARLAAGGRRSRRSSRPPTTRSSPRPGCARASACSCTAAAGGVGTAAVQLGRAAGARVTATVRREELRPGVEQLGATRDRARRASASTGPSTWCSSWSAPANLAENLKALATGGRIAVIGVGGPAPRPSSTCWR